MSSLDRRIGLLFAGFLVLLSFALVRTVYLGTIKGSTLAKAAAVQQVADDVVPARRGTITDRTGIELAVSEEAGDVSATPYLIKDPVKIAEKLAPILKLDAGDLLKKLARKDTGFVYLKRGAPAAAVDAIKKDAIEGINIDPAEQRFYPRQWSASQVLGGVNLTGNGYAGVESEVNSKLRGLPGKRRVVSDALGQTIKSTDEKTAKPGSRVKLTISAPIQERAEQVLAQVGKQYSPKGASAIVMDPRDGSVLAMANWPKIDANDPSGAPVSAQMNKATGFVYEPGSTFKPFTVAGALSEGLITPKTEFTLPPQITLYDRTIHNAEDRGTETMTTGDILARSDNVGAITIGLKLGAKSFDSWVRKFGFGKPTGIDLPGEEQGIQPALKQYSGSSMGNLPIGQGESVTPLQIATAYSAIANGGILRPAHVIDRVGGKKVAEPKGKRIISGKVSAQLRTMLEGVLNPGGTASEISIPGYKLAGKTGTANVVDHGEYSDTKYVASFVGFAPADDPKLLVSVMVDEPHGAIYGGSVAAPAFGKIAQYALQYLRIAPK